MRPSQSSSGLERSLLGALYRQGEAWVTERGLPSAPVAQSVSCVIEVCWAPWSGGGGASLGLCPARPSQSVSGLREPSPLGVQCVYGMEPGLPPAPVNQPVGC